MNERQGHGQATEDVGLLDGDPADVVEPRQATMLDDEFQVGEVGGGDIDVANVKGVLVERNDRRTFVDV